MDLSGARGAEGPVMTIPHSTNTMPPNTTDRIHSDFHLVSWTKDSILVRWRIEDGQRPYVTGFRIIYQAIGSTVRQQIHLDAARTEYDITQLHENTNYEMCMHVSTNLTDKSELREECIKASTATDSLSVALGSTFGAFLALGIIVMFVFLAKWQHQRKLKRQLQQMSVDESFDSVAAMQPNDAEIELSDVSLQVNDENSSPPSSQESSALANGAALRRKSSPAEPVLQQTQLHPEPSTSTAGDGLLKPPLPPGVTPAKPDPPPDVRPKERSVYHQNGCDDRGGGGGGSIRQNHSCNW